MLQSIRNRAQGVFAWIILILICIPFAFWGIQNYLGGGQEQAIAVVGDKEIYQADLNQAYQRMVSRLGDVSQVNEEMLKKLALKNLIDQEVLRQSAMDRGYVISDGQIRDAIRAMPYFKNDKGFDKEKFDNALRAQSISEPYFIAQIRDSMEIGQLQDGITQSTFATTAEIERFIQLRDQQRVIEYLTVPLDQSTTEVSAAEIEKFYKSNEAEFRYPEQVSVQYIELKLNDIASNLAVKDTDLVDYYESQKDLYTKNERRKISHVLATIDLKDREASEKAALEKIRQAQTMLNEGTEFAEVAKQLSDDKVSAQKGGNLGLMNLGDFDKEFETAAYALELGQVSEPVKSAFGYHLIKLTELEPGEVKPFDSVRAEVETNFRRQQAENRFYELGEKLAQISYENPDSLLPAAESAGLKILNSGLFDRQATQGFAANEKVRSAAFSEQVLEGNNSEPVELSNEHVVILRLDKHIAATTKPLDEVRDEIVKRIETQRVKKLTKDKADQYFQELKDGASINEIAQKNGLELKKPEPVARTATDIPRELLTAVFKAKKPVKESVVPVQVALADGQQIIAALLKVQNPAESDEKDSEKEADTSKQWLGTQYANAEFSDLLAQLRENIEITMNEEEE